jgi:hypothetical protein
MGVSQTMSDTASKEASAVPALKEAEQTKRAVDIAYRLYAAKLYADASNQCTQILKAIPEQFDALYLQALVSYRAGNHSAAEFLIERACKICPAVTRFDHLVGFLEQRRQAGWLRVHETRLREFRRSLQINAYIVSYPKCGRTWVRMMLGRYLLGEQAGDPLEVFELTKAKPGVPNVEFTHDDYPQLKPTDRLCTDKSMYRGKKVVLLVRDPRDVVVSYYFQYTRRGAKERANDAQFNGTLSDFIRQNIGGLNSIIGFYNIWALNRMIPASFYTLRYEALHTNPDDELHRLIEFLGIPDFGGTARKSAIQHATFKNMRRIEEADLLKNPRLRTGAAGDPEAFKVRRGVVGGYRNYFTPDDMLYVDDVIRRTLDPSYREYC